MDVVFWYSSEPNWEENFNRLKNVVGDRATIHVHDGRHQSKKQNLEEIAVKLTLQSGFDKPFILVEGDNWVFDNFNELLDYQGTAKFLAKSPYGFSYQHGGIKVVTPEQVFTALKRVNTEHDISVYFSLANDISVPYSRHSFDTSLLSEFKTAAKEIIKLYWWGNEYLLNLWQSTPRSKRIYDTIINHITKFNISVVTDPVKTNELIEEIFYSDFMKIAIMGIMKNEEKHISRYLEDYSQFGKIFLLDTGSTDASVSKCYGKCHLFVSKFDQVNYSDFRNKLLELADPFLADYDFMMWVDIDETPDMSKCSVQEFKKFLANQPSSLKLFEFNRFDIGGSPPIQMIRIFRIPSVGKWIYQIHEQFILANRNESHLPILTPLCVDHLESERIQIFDKFVRYRELITENFLRAEAAKDPAEIFHYLFFYVDVVSQSCNSAELVRVFNDHVKGGQQFEFAAWYLRKFLSYFACMRDKNLVAQAEQVIASQYPQHLEYARFTEQLVENVAANGAPFDKAVDPSGFRDFPEVAYPIQLMISIEGEITEGALSDLEAFADNLARFYKINLPFTLKGFSHFNSNQILITFDFESSVRYYQLHGTTECSLAFIELMLIVIKHGLQKTVGVVRK